MAGRMSRNKGAGGEREIIGLLQPVVNEVCAEEGCVPFELVRDTRQRYQAKLYDVHGLPWMALEVKRVENQSGINGWWHQAVEATKEGQVTVLAYRQNHKPWMVRMRVPISVVKGVFDSRGFVSPVRVMCNVTVTWEDFVIWFGEKLRSEITRA